MHISALPRKGAYARAWRTLLALAPTDTVKLDWNNICSAGEARRQFRNALQRRISGRAGASVQGRKCDPEYQLRLWRDSRRLRDIAHRIRVYQFESDEARRRFSHLLSHHDD